MSLPLSPPPSRSSSKTSVSRKPATYDPNERIISPISPSTSPSPNRKPKPTLTLNPLAMPCAQATTTTFLTSPNQTPSTAASSTLRSFFSPCSDSEDEDEDDEDDDDECSENGTPIKSASAKPRGHFQRLWASHDPPSMPPSSPPPALPSHLSTPLSPTFGWRTNPNPTPSPEKEQFLFSGPNTPARFPSHRPSRLATYRMPPAPSAPATGVFPPPSPWGDGLSYLNSPTIPTPSDPLLQNLQTLLKAQLQSLDGIFTAPPPAELVIARAERDRLLVKTQKAYFRRTPQEAVVEMHVELAEMEEKVRALERTFVKGFLGALEGFVDGVKEGCRGFMAEGEEEGPEVVEVDVQESGLDGVVEEDEEEDEDVYVDAREWPEEEVTSLFEDSYSPSQNDERRFTWTPSSFDEEEEEEEEEDDVEEGDYYADHTADPSFAPLPPLAPDEELYHSEYTLSPSNSSCGLSPLVDVGCACGGACDCWSSFLPPSPALSCSSQRMMGCSGKGTAEHLEKRWGENVVVVQGVEMRMI